MKGGKRKMVNMGIKMEGESNDLESLAYRISDSMFRLGNNVYNNRLSIDSFSDSVDLYVDKREKLLGIEPNKYKRFQKTVKGRETRFLGSQLEPYFALHYTLNMEKPDKVVAIMGGARHLAGASEFFGFPVTLVEAHRETSEKYNGVNFRMLTPEKFEESDKVLILEDGIHFSDSERTYEIVIRNLDERGVRDPSLFIECLNYPYLIQDGVSEANLKRIVIQDRPYFSSSVIPHDLYEHSRLLKEMANKNDLSVALKSFVEEIGGNGA
jgi:hypothetical protein